MLDAGFGNQIDLDSVCVLSSYTTITFVTYSLYAIGIYAFRVCLDKAKICFFLEPV